MTKVTIKTGVKSSFETLLTAYAKETKGSAFAAEILKDIATKLDGASDNQIKACIKAYDDIEGLMNIGCIDIIKEGLTAKALEAAMTVKEKKDTKETAKDAVKNEVLRKASVVTSYKDSQRDIVIIRNQLLTLNYVKDSISSVELDHRELKALKQSKRDGQIFEGIKAFCVFSVAIDKEGVCSRAYNIGGFHKALHAYIERTKEGFDIKGIAVVTVSHLVESMTDKVKVNKVALDGLKSDFLNFDENVLKGEEVRSLEEIEAEMVAAEKVLGGNVKRLEFLKAEKAAL